MYWSRVKTILIILFLLVNVILFTSVMVFINKSVTVSRITIDNTVGILEKNNIHVDKKLISNKIESLNIAEVENIIADKDAFAKQLLGEGYLSNAEKTVYTKDNAKLEFLENQFVYSKTIANSLIGPDIKSVQFLLKNIGIVVDETNIIKTSDITFSIYQKIETKPLFEGVLNVKLSSGLGEYEVKGFWVNVKNSNKAKNNYITLRHVTGILIELLNNDELKGKQVTITNIELGYSIGNNYNHKILSAYPCYKITANDGKSYFYDASSGDYIYSKINGS